MDAIWDVLLDEHAGVTRPRLERLWRYYRNAMVMGHAGGSGTRAFGPGGASDSAWGGRGRFGRGYSLGQEEGLPRRLASGEVDPLGQSVERERVVENDIAWRIHTLVDFMFSRMVSIQSVLGPTERGNAIEGFLRDVIEANGGIRLFQDMALLGSVYGYVDLLVRLGDAGSDRPVVIEVVEPTRAVPLLNDEDYRQLDGYAVVVEQRDVLKEAEEHERVMQGGLWSRLRDRVMSRGSVLGSVNATEERVMTWTAESYQEMIRAVGAGYTGGDERRVLVDEVNPLGVVPVVHIQNFPQPLVYAGLSEVEPLIPLQDELNTRLSDRANRVTFQSFKMYLGKGIEGFTDRPVGPGQMWATDNPDASVEAFGGDSGTPSEDRHISEIRDALDKTSAVPPIAAGIIRDKIGNLTSENALRVVMMGLLAKTEKKRVTYGEGIKRLCGLVLHAADVSGVFATDADERGVRLEWPEALPTNEEERLKQAQMKLDLGVPRRVVLAELGYGDLADSIGEENLTADERG